MKKAVLAVAMTVTGMALALAILPAFGFEFGFLDAFRLRSTSYTIGESFENIEVLGGKCDVSISAAYDDRCQVYIRDRKNTVRTARVEDGTLVVSVQAPERWYEALDIFGDADRSVSISLPEKEYGALTVRTDSGDVYVTDDMGFGSVGLETSGGEVYMSDAEAQSLSVSSDSGNLSMDTVTAAGTMTVTSGSGNIWMWDCDGAELRIESGSGDVSGSFLRPKNFVTSTRSGSIDVPMPDRAAGLCAVTTDSGDIWLYVEN